MNRRITSGGSGPHRGRYVDLRDVGQSSRSALLEMRTPAGQESASRFPPNGDEHLCQRRTIDQRSDASPDCAMSATSTFAPNGLHPGWLALARP